MLQPLQARSSNSNRSEINGAQHKPTILDGMKKQTQQTLQDDEASQLLLQLIQNNNPLDNTQNDEVNGTFCYYQQIEPFPHYSIKDFVLKPLNDQTFGHRNDNKEKKEDSYWKAMPNYKNKTILKEHKTMTLKSGCIIFPDNSSKYIDFKYLKELKRIINKNKWYLYEIYPDKYCLYRIFQRLLFGESKSDKYLFVEKCVQTFLGNDDNNNNECILNALSSIYNIIIRVYVLNMNQNELTWIEYGDINSNKKREKVSIAQYNKFMYVMVKDYGGKWKVSLLNNYENIISQNVAFALKKRKEKVEKRKKINKKITKYKQCMNELFSLLNAKKSAQYNLVEMVDIFQIKWSKKVYKLFLHISSYFTNKNISDLRIEGKVMGNGEINKHEIYNKYIYEFLKINEFQTLNINPKITISCEKHVFFSDIIIKKRMRNHRICELNDEFGLIAIENIPKCTVLGQYFGVLCFEDEYNTIYSDSYDEFKYNLYTFSMSVNTEIDYKLSEYLLGKKNKKNKKRENHTFRIVIDALRLNDMFTDLCPFMFMNDCRKNINLKYPNKNDDKYWNVEYVEMFLNEWPSIFIVAKRDIKKGEELCSFYGRDYGGTLTEKKQQESNQKELNQFYENIKAKLNSI